MAIHFNLFSFFFIFNVLFRTRISISKIEARARTAYSRGTALIISTIFKGRNKMRQSRSLSAPAFLFTGLRHNNRYRLDVDGQTVWLPRSSLQILLKLVLARGSSESGFVRADGRYIHRLRHQLAAAVGPDRARALIE